MRRKDKKKDKTDEELLDRHAQLTRENAKRTAEWEAVYYEQHLQHMQQQGDAAWRLAQFVSAQAAVQHRCAVEYFERGFAANVQDASLALASGGLFPPAPTTLLSPPLLSSRSHVASLSSLPFAETLVLVTQPSYLNRRIFKHTFRHVGTNF